MAKTNAQTTTKRPSRVEGILKDLSDRYGTVDLDLTYIDNLGNAERFRDEFVRLPYELPSGSECRW